MVVWPPAPHFKNCSAGPGHCLQQPLVKAGDPFICFRNTKRFPCLHSLIQIREGLEEFDTIIRLREACCYGGGSAKREDKALSSLVGIKDNTYTYLEFIPPYYLNNCFATFMLNNLNSLLCIILGVLSLETLLKPLPSRLWFAPQLLTKAESLYYRVPVHVFPSLWSSKFAKQSQFGWLLASLKHTWSQPKSGEQGFVAKK